MIRWQVRGASSAASPLRVRVTLPRPVQLHPCMSNLGGQSANWQADFPLQVWTERSAAAGQALNAEAAVTVAEPKWPPPIQNAAAACCCCCCRRGSRKRPAHGRFTPGPSASLSPDHRWVCTGVRQCTREHVGRATGTRNVVMTRDDAASGEMKRRKEAKVAKAFSRCSRA